MCNNFNVFVECDVVYCFSLVKIFYKNNFDVLKVNEMCIKGIIELGKMVVIVVFFGVIVVGLSVLDIYLLK